LVENCDMETSDGYYVPAAATDKTDCSKALQRRSDLKPFAPHTVRPTNYLIILYQGFYCYERRPKLVWSGFSETIESHTFLYYSR
jgi:hypothetical protein